MASDIVPIRLSLTEGDLVTLWAPRWREDGEEWEAFLGDDDALFAFPEVAQLAAFVRTVAEHDLTDHPAWSVVPDLTVAELTPEETRCYDIVGVPGLVAQDADVWTVGDLAEVVEMVRSLAEVCGLETVTAVLDSAPGFALLDHGTVAFDGREGARLWTQLLQTVAQRWDDVIDALDGVVAAPQVDATALVAAQTEAAALAEREAEQERALRVADPEADDEDIEAEAAEIAVEEQVAADERDDAPPGFWEKVGIDPIRITTRDDEFVTLRCYLDDKPVFLGTDGTIDVFGSERALARHLAAAGRDGHALAAAATWPDVVERASVGELEITVDEVNAYVLTGIDDDITEGVHAVDPTQLELAAELLLDVGEWAGDDEPRAALAESESLGWLVSFMVRPDPTRLAPSPPFDAEAARWRVLVAALEARLRRV